MIEIKLTEPNKSICKCSQLFHKFSAEDAEEFEAKCSACSLEYEIKDLAVTEK